MDTMHICYKHHSKFWVLLQCIHALGGIGRVTIIVLDPAAGVKKHALSWRCHPSFVRFGSDSVGDVTRIPCNAVPPDRDCRVNPTLKPVFRSAETGEAERLREWQNSLKSPNIE
jgi:hypothetical protein